MNDKEISEEELNIEAIRKSIGEIYKSSQAMANMIDIRETMAVSLSGLGSLQKVLSNIGNSIDLTPIKVMADSVAKYQEILNPIATQFKDFLKEVEAISDSLAKDNPKRIRTLKMLSENGWTIGSDENAGMVIVDEVFELNEKEANDYLMNYFTANNFEKMFQELDYMIGFLDYGFKKQVKISKKLLKDDIDNLIMVIPTLFEVLTYVIDKKSNNLSTEKSVGSGYEKKVKEKLNKSNLGKDVYLEILLNILKVIGQFYKYGASFPEGIFKSEFSRPTVMHGRFDPNRYTKKNLFQVILLINSIKDYYPLIDYYRIAKDK
ncbi:hypothetical protein EGT49_07730 [Companilactobacillus suantsaicola]|uniref:Uncharacterized protein n=1 Tax=Companilactobacillus suantsaicola TaxID=2487723 RepID=A0A4Z0JKH0_9LACO|nr:hypothetical protein [Companilactobacillus suantsaicola]TGD22807.1 hypothetical protein EGT49_07730 [Companilactobacillus suantsaicola]